MSLTEKNSTDQIKSQFVGYVLAAFSFVAGLAWNEAVKAFIETLVPIGSGGVVAKFLYAIIVTLVLAFASWMLLRKKKSTGSLS